MPQNEPNKKSVLFVDHYPWPFLKFRIDLTDFFMEKNWTTSLLIWNSKNVRSKKLKNTLTLVESKVSPHSVGVSSLLRSIFETLKYSVLNKRHLVFIYGLKQSAFRSLGNFFFKKKVCLIAGTGRINRKSSLIRFFLKFTLSQYNLIITLNEYDAIYFRKLLPNILIRSIPSEGLNFPSNHSTRTTISLKDREIRCCYIGRIISQKGVSYLISEFRKLPNNLKLDVYGPLEISDSDEYIDLKIGALDEQARIVYHGEVSSAFDILPEVDFLILPSVYGEGMPMVILEAMLANVIPIFCAIPQLSHITEHTDILTLPINWKNDDLLSIIDFYKGMTDKQLCSFLLKNNKYVHDFHEKNFINNIIFDLCNDL